MTSVTRRDAAYARLVERAVTSIARGLAQAGWKPCPCGHLPHTHQPDSTHPDLIHWCPTCTAACTPVNHWRNPQ